MLSFQRSLKSSGALAQTLTGKLLRPRVLSIRLFSNQKKRSDIVFKALQNYAGFSGRAQRSEYWLFYLFYILAAIVGVLLDLAMGTLDPLTGIGAVSGIITLALIIPSIAVSFRRLHDTDRSAWWLLIGLVPLIGGIVLLVFFCLDGTPGENRFGPNPKELVPADA
jgi:uncharacterized membrane protein YhaH (DUF805 family)